MANILYDSFLNPVKFHPLDNVQLPNYVSRFMDDWAFRRTIQPWDQHVCFYQPWSKHDEVRIQYTSNFGPITLRMYDEQGTLKLTQAFVNKQQDELRPEFFIRQIAVSLSTYDPGKYFFTRDCAGAITYSEPFEILEAEENEVELQNQNPTLCLEYYDEVAAGGIKFFVPFRPMIRIPGIIRYKGPGAKDNIYEDQLLNVSMVNSVPFRVHELIVGGVYGVPPYFIDKIARANSLKFTSYDGRQFTKNEGSAFEPAIAEGYPMRGWSIELRETLNRDSLVIENDNIIEGIAAAALIIDNKGFGISGGDNSYQQINYLQ